MAIRDPDARGRQSLCGPGSSGWGCRARHGFGVLVTSQASRGGWPRSFPRRCSPGRSSSSSSGCCRKCPIAAVALTTFLINSRHLFYGLSFPLQRVNGWHRKSSPPFIVLTMDAFPRRPRRRTLALPRLCRSWPGSSPLGHAAVRHDRVQPPSSSATDYTEEPAVPNPGYIAAALAVAVAILSRCKLSRSASKTP